MEQLAKLILRLTHRIVYERVMVRDLYPAWRFAPQWWFLWWHHYWYDIGPDFYIPRAFETPDEAREFFHDKGIFDYKDE